MRAMVVLVSITAPSTSPVMPPSRRIAVAITIAPTMSPAIRPANRHEQWHGSSNNSPEAIGSRCGHPLGAGPKQGHPSRDYGDDKCQVATTSVHRSAECEDLDQQGESKAPAPRRVRYRTYGRSPGLRRPAYRCPAHQRYRLGQLDEVRACTR